MRCLQARLTESSAGQKRLAHSVLWAASTEQMLIAVQQTFPTHGSRTAR